MKHINTHLTGRIQRVMLLAKVTVLVFASMLVLTGGTVYAACSSPDADSVELSLNWDINNDGCNDTKDLITMIFRLLAGIVGIAVVGGIAWGGMLYASSNGNASKAQQGITTIVNAVIGLLLFIFMFAITNFLVPGGVIG